MRAREEAWTAENLRVSAIETHVEGVCGLYRILMKCPHYILFSYEQVRYCLSVQTNE